MKRKRLLLLLALLITAATGAWAQSATTHVVTQATVNDIFSGDGYTLGDAVKEGDVLDFQGIIDIDHSLVINKPVNIISSKKDAVIKLHTVAGILSGENPGNSFVINKAGSGTTVKDIRIENTQTWLYNTSNVTFTGVTMWVEGVTVSSGVGQVSIRYSDHITFDGCTVYAKNNGGSSGCMLVGSHDCTFKDTRFEAVGSAGNVLYLGSIANIGDKPADYTMNADNISVLNCTLTKDVANPICMFAIGGLRHHIEGCTIVNMNASSGWGATVPNSANEGHTILNNTITGGTLNVLNYCTAEGNTVTGNASVTINQGATANNNTFTVTGSVTINQGATANNNTITGTGTGNVIVRKGATVTGNTINNNVEVSANGSDYIGSTITGNAINGTVTFATNSKNNTLTRNVITSTGDYAVVMASTTNANNTVRYNTLIAATKKGDEAVNPSTGTGNTISNNSTIALMLADGTKDAANWSATVNGEQPNPLPVGGLSNGDAVTLKYGGRLKVKNVTATHDGWNGDLSNIPASLIQDDGTVIVPDGTTLKGTLDVANKPYKIAIPDDATVTLDGVTINGVSNVSYKWAGLNCLGNATIVLKDGTTNTVRGFWMIYPGIHVPEGSTLTITGGKEGNGKLIASSNGFGAGIGGGFDASSDGICGNITITGGDITATGGDFCAGIGGGCNQPCGNISIEGGSVTATGGTGAAGIGGGINCSCGNITITNGVTRVTASNGGAAPYSIGAGNPGTCGTIIIGCTLDTDGNPVGGKKYWENNAAVDSDADNYLRQATIIYPEP